METSELSDAEAKESDLTIEKFFWKKLVQNSVCFHICDKFQVHQLNSSKSKNKPEKLINNIDMHNHFDPYLFIQRTLIDLL